MNGKILIPLIIVIGIIVGIYKAFETYGSFNVFVFCFIALSIIALIMFLRGLKNNNG